VTTFYIQQFGCRATHADGAAIERQLLDRGCTAAESPQVADLIVVNTCTVTSAADAQAREAIRALSRRSPPTRIIVTGCYAQRAPEELAALPGVFAVVGNSHKPLIPDLAAPLPGVSTPGSDFVSAARLHSSAPGPGRAAVITGDIFAVGDFLAAPVLGGEGNHTRPTLKIQDGCSNRCAFCVIPFVRGRSRSLPPAAVVAELGRLAATGHREVVLSGINLGAWGRDLSPRRRFPDLLRQILAETAVERLRLSSIEPLDVTRDLIDLFALSRRLADHFHMPLQSGSDPVLAAMRRWYRAEHYARRVELVAEALPHAAIGADVMAGFPGESEEDHARTLDFLRARPFAYLHVFSYSARPGTRAAGLPLLPPAVVRRRARELRALGEQKAAEFFAAQAGRSLSVLTLRGRQTPQAAGWTAALSSNYLKVQVAGSWPPNRFLTVDVPGDPRTAVVPHPEVASDPALPVRGRLE
jgi:threonylcarbamoyladenosine tRNA methylthiotransferase MtaB